MNPKMQASDAADFLNISLQAIHKNIKTNHLESFKNQNKMYFCHDTAKEIFKLNVEPTCFTWQNLKGGVGKTNLSFATAARLSSYGLKVLVIDLDQQGNFTQACNIDAENKPVMFDIIKDSININDCIVEVTSGLDILPSRIENALLDNLFAVNGLPVDREFKKRITPLKKKYDIIFIDCPPSLSSSVCAATLCADYVILPTDPEKFSLSGLQITLNEIKKNISERYDIDVNIKILLNKFDARTNLSHQVLTALLSNENFNSKLFKSFIRTSQEFPNSISKGLTIFDSLKPSTAKEDIDLLCREIIDLCKDSH
ncbi:ParA family protein [Cysteiniphilum marinum]|uniref:ParA family protein n=1 Tax=Cysteiniphilum marinum TaxID=2774191 RepID=UPI00193C1A5D|nr:ParA family protein [Cysteiniphilum marinum]